MDMATTRLNWPWGRFNENHRVHKVSQYLRYSKNYFLNIGLVAIIVFALFSHCSVPQCSTNVSIWSCLKFDPVDSHHEHLSNTQINFKVPLEEWFTGKSCTWQKWDRNSQNL